YDAMTFEAQRKVGDITFDAHWTWGNSFANYLNLENPYKHDYWNRDGLTPRHRVVTTIFWNLPVGKGKAFLGNANHTTNLLLGGWMVSLQSLFQTGLNFSPSYSGSDPSNTNTVGGLPNRIANGNLPADQRDVNRWFDSSAFTAPLPGQFGNSGINILE